MLSHTVYIVGQVVASGPNWVTLGVVFGTLVLLMLIVLLLPNGIEKNAIESDKKDRKAIDDKSPTKSLSDGECQDKDKMSLAEIKEAKRAGVGEDKSAEELRELRRERRAATQTANAIQEREDAEAKADTAGQGQDSEESEKSDNDKPSAAEILSAGEVMASAETDAGDVFASLFGGMEDSDLIFDDVLDMPKPADGPVFPTLGSALIPLDELTAADDTEDGVVDTLGELTKRLKDSSEKKTPD